MNYTCPICNGQWTTDYCPQCGHTITQKENERELGNLQPLPMVEQPMLNRSATRGKINILWKILAIVFALCIATAAVLYYTKPSSQEFSAYIATKGIPPGVLYFQIKSPFYYSDNCVFDGKEITHRYIGVFGHFYEVNPPKKGETSGKEPQVLRSHVEQRRIKNQNDLGCTGDTHVAEHRREVAELVCQQVGHD